MTISDVNYAKEQVIENSKKYFNGYITPAETWTRKYCLRSSEFDDNSQLLFLENTPEQMFHRCATALANNEDDFDKWYDIFRSELDGFKRLVLQGSPMAGLGNPKNVSFSNCFVIPSPEDNIESIMKSVYNMAQIQAYRGGVGVDVSNLRPEGALVSNSANSSSGAWSWCDLFSYVTRLIGQNGRVGALMITMRVDHPDIFNFIKMKSDLAKVTGANVSIRITDEFMNAVKKDENFDLKFHFTDLKYENIRKTIRARDLWDEICKYATSYAEPGLLMWDNILSNSPADSYHNLGFRTISTNPCAELPLCENDSCRLASLNLTGFVINSFEKNAKFDFDLFKNSIRIGIRALDNIVDLDNVPFDKIREKARLGRRLGLGTHGLADCMTKLGIKYDSNEGIKFTNKIFKFMANESYRYSVELGKEKGIFPIFDWELEKDNKFINRLDDDVKEEIKKHGRRNIALLTCAPTGTVSMLSNPNSKNYGSWGVSSGVEPTFSHFYMRKIKITNSEKDVKPDSVDVDGIGYKHHYVVNSVLLEYLNKHSNDISESDLKNIKLPNYFVTSNEIDWRKRIEIQATMQKWIDHGISSTINLPSGTTVETVKDLYEYAWQSGLKGVTIYVDGCRSGILTSSASNKPQQIDRKSAPDRPSELEAIAHVVGTNGNTYNIYLGFYKGNIYEVFAVKKSDIGIGVIDGSKGKIIKRASKVYDFESKNGLIKNINKHEDSEISSFTRLLSTSLRHGVPLEVISEQLIKSKGIVSSMAKAINRIISQYVIGDIEVNEPCDQCEYETTIIVKGCRQCQKCGWKSCS